MLSNTLRLSFIHILHPSFHPKVIGKILKNKHKNVCVCIHEIIRLTIMKMKMKIKNRSHRFDINKHRSRHGHKYSTYKECLTIMMLICIKQYFFQEELMAFRTTLCFRFFQYFSKIKINFPSTPYVFHLKFSPLCQTLSKALEISRNTPLTSFRGLQLNEL